MIKVSANIIVKNEIKNIEKCINSIRPYCNEIVIVDTGSTDGTLEFLKECKGIKLYEKKWNDHFADMRNYAKSKCTGDWILVIDGDETLQSFNIPSYECDYFICNVAMKSELGHRLIFPSIRMFRNLPEIKYEGKRHAVIDYTVLGLRKGTADIVFYHPKISRKELTEKMIKNLEIHKEQLITEPDNEMNYYNLMRTYFYLNDWNKAIEYGELALSSKINRQLKAVTCILLYLALCNQNRQEYGIQFLSLSIQLIPKQVLTRYLLYKFFKQIKQTKLMKETWEEMDLISQSGKSDLPNDIFFNKKLKKELQNG